MCVRKLEVSEIKELRDIYNNNWAEVYYVKMRRARTLSSFTYGFFVDDDNSIVSEITLEEIYDSDKEEKCAEISWHTTQLSKWNQGYGSSVLKYAINACRTKGYKYIVASIEKGNEIARYIYEKHGFKCRGLSVNINKMVYILDF